jgi:flagellum-specific ATP synthase
VNSALAHRIQQAQWLRRSGRIVRVVGQTVEAEGPSARLGEVCEIRVAHGAEAALAEVIGISDRRVLLMPYGDLRGCKAGSEVLATGRDAQAPVGRDLLGRVVDAFGVELETGEDWQAEALRPLNPPPINPLDRGVIEHCLETGVRAIDALLPVGRGQRLGIFAGSGVGKSTLLGMLARDVRSDVMVVALVGERGREVRAFVDHLQQSDARDRTIVVAATSDQPPLVRCRAAFYATAIAEYFRDQGKHVALLMDSITRVATAQREMGLATGELPTARGYTPSVFAMLPRLLERGGVSRDGGSVTGLYTVLVDGDDMNDPIADAVRAILDGHIVLSRTIAQRGRYPAIDILQSISRLAPVLCSTAERAAMESTVKALAAYEAARDLIEVGAWRGGTQTQTDKAIQLYPKIEAFLAQAENQHCSRAQAVEQLQRLLADTGKSP